MATGQGSAPALAVSRSRAQAFELLVAASGTVALAALVAGWPSWRVEIWAFVLAAALAGRFPVPLPGRHAVINLTAVVYLTALYVFGTAPAALVAATGSIASAVWRRKPAYVASFNAGATVLAIGPAGAFAASLAPRAGLLADVVAASVYWLLNSAIVSARSGMLDGRPWWRALLHTWRDLYLQVIAMSSLAFLAATLWREGPGYTLLLTVPSAALYQSMQLVVEKQRQNERLEETVRARTAELVQANRELERSHAEAHKRNAELAMLVRVTEVVNRSLDTDETLGEAVQVVADALGAQGGLVQIADHDGPAITLAHRGLAEPLLEPLLRGELLERLARPQESSDTPWNVRLAGPEPWTAGVARVLYGSGSPGVLALVRAGERGFTSDEHALLLAVGHQIGLAVRNATLFHAEREKVRRLEEIDQTRHQFVATVSHELRTPLTAIKGYLEMVRAGRLGPLTQEQARFLGIVSGQIDHLTHLLNDLLDLSRMRAGRLRLQKEPLALASVAGEVVASYAQLAVEKGITLRSAVPLTLPPVWYDRRRLLQVLANLVGNALKFTPPHGTVTIEATVRHREVVVAVRDTGVGIPPEALGRLFERFYQVEPARAGGTGLGLYIARQIVVAHGGRIWVESQPGEGSVFSFSMPLGAGETEVAPPLPLADEERKVGVEAP